MQYWLLKTEPETYSFSDLLREKKTPWSGVRNYQARNFLRQVKKGDLALIYHSGKDKAVVGVAKVIKGSYPEVDREEKGDWVQVDLEPSKPLPSPVKLAQIKSERRLTGLLLIRHTRLSVMPVSETEFKTILMLGAASTK
jgi:predicted RNA-binding protein with PUA-like domain